MLTSLVSLRKFNHKTFRFPLELCFCLSDDRGPKKHQKNLVLLKQYEQNKNTIQLSLNCHRSLPACHPMTVGWASYSIFSSDKQRVNCL